ncbi:MAG: AraC family transcriptional regulator [Lachnospiraceae bacterium]|nr:AraC family transcriptional regulator [Lachnospiraceae bacterium]
MYRIILIDDEPLILAGIASLICWEEHDCCIVGKATNGHDAIDLIMETQPDIIITDIRMPVMNGLELIEACQAKHCEFAFLFLTNLEDFQLAKQAVRLGAVDYLVKLDLQPQTLIQALDRAKEHCSRMESHHNKEMYTLLLKDTQKQQERNYFSQLLLSPPDIDLPSNPEISARYQNAYLILLQMKPEQILFGHAEAYDFQFISSQLLDIVSGIAARYFSVHTILIPHKDTLLLVVCPKPESDNNKSLSEFCTKVNVALGTYFALTALFGISQKKAEPAMLPDAFREAQSAMNHCYYESSLRIAFYKNQESRPRQPAQREFNINFLKKSMSTAVLENESQDLKNIFRELTELFTQYKPDKTQAASACINIYSYLHDLLQNESSEDNAFPYSIDIAGQLSRLNSLDDILQWLNSFCDKMCTLLTERKEKRSDKFVHMAKRYIHEHYNDKLTLSDIADHLRISPGYLSTSFSNYMNRTVSDYIAEVKIEHAKELIDSGQYLIYEIANQLGFENAYYFSKVFKKVTGMSPKNYECRNKTNNIKNDQ